MSEEGSSNRLLSQVAPSRRGFVKSVLAGATFAAPVIASFGLENMEIRSADGQIINSSQSVYLSSSVYSSSSSLNRCLPDLGYVGPSFFQAYVLDISGSTRVNGVLTFSVEQDGKSLGVRMRMSRDASVSAVSLTVNSVNVANVQLHNDHDGFGRRDNESEGRITAADVIGLCDFDALLQAMASQTAKAVVLGSYASSSFDAEGSVLPMAGGPVFHTENRG
jgi:hypothetical protein